MKTQTSIRQGQLISPFGTGALHVSSDGISLITTGLDFWFQPECADKEETLYPPEFKILEPRLQKILNVDFFYAPPDYRRWERYEENQINKGVKIPFLRFPASYFCQKCHYIQKLLPTQKDDKPACRKCGKQKLVPVPFVVICDHGHAQEFPWNEWVHKSLSPACNGENLYFKDTGTPGLAGLKIECKDCNLERTLVGITSANSPEDTFLTNGLADTGEPYLCKGRKPWLFNSKDIACARPVRASLRGASNLYFPIIKSAIHIPLHGIPKKLQQLFENDLALTSILDLTPDVSIDKLKAHPNFHALKEFSNDEIAKAIQIYLSDKKKQSEAKVTGKRLSEIQHELRIEEYGVISQKCNAEDLQVKPIDASKYGKIISKYFDSVCLVERLRETRALTGFTRVFPDTDMQPEEMQRLMWDVMPPKGERWLPANIIYGEGIFLLFNKEKIRAWEQNPHVIARARNLRLNYSKAQEQRKLPPKDELSPRFVLIHTVAHLLISQMTYEAGYSTASLRERLYVSEGDDDMHGLLIYTAAGDSDGTMGGLVRLGEPGQLESTLEQAIENARWCSTDPVCMEMGDQGGQGPDNCNLAVCHNCGLLPETACEEFNRFLDRGLVIGTEKQPGMGFFNQET